MRRILLTTAGLGAFCLFLGFMVWGIRTLQHHKPAAPVVSTTPVTTPEVAMPKPTSVTELRRVSVFFQNRSEPIHFSDQPLVRVTKIGGKAEGKKEGRAESMLDETAATALIARIPVAKDLPSPTPGTLERGKIGLKRIIRGQPGLVVDVARTLESLAENVKAHPDSASYQVVVSYRDGEDSQGFDSLRAQEGFRELVCTFETIHADHITDAGRNENLRLAALKIDGFILQPGEEFNFDRVVGQRSRKNGFKEAGVISGGKVIPGLGGGVCQVSTTLYRCALLANQKILERHNHSIYEGIPYADRGLDAAVSWGSKNFRFKNTLDIPLLISCAAGDGRVHAAIYADRKPFDLVRVETRKEKAMKFPVKKTNNPSEARPGVVGYTIEAYRLVTVNGGQKEDFLGRDLYQMFPQIEVASN
ncbi:MAG: VanW family protein [Candidatus Ozemobacteraceae bacterium]